jgi:diacylglycerol O-acyltransferase
VPDRLSALDASFLHVEDQFTPMHVGSVMVFDTPEGGFDVDRLVALIDHRIAQVPRYRQRVLDVPGRISNPVWADDASFDITYHVRQSGLPRPGTDEQLEEFVARIASRPLDHRRPLWECYLVDGLAHGRFAVVTKTHHALVDGVNAVDLAQLILSGDREDGPEAMSDDAWRPRPTPGDLQLIGDALVDLVRRPTQVAETIRGGISDVQATGARVLGALGQVVSTVARASTRPAPSSPLNVEVSGARRFVMVGTDLEDYRIVRSHLMKGRFAEDVTVNDVVLATIAGALRAWLLTRGEAVNPATTVRAMVPISFESDTASTAVGGGLRACFIDLPVGESGPSMRLHQIAFAMRQQMETGVAVGAETLASIGGFAPPTLHSLGARLGGAVSRRLYNLVITNVPGPQQPLYAAGATLIATYPVMPLGRGQGLSIGLTSYDGGVYYGLLTDRDALPDADVLGQCIVDALAELKASNRSKRI